MELKSQNMQINLGESQSFNRTFMELKLRKLPDNKSKPTVLIVPLWN